IDLLIEIEAGLVTRRQVRLELQAVEPDLERAVQRAGEDAVGLRQPLELARRRLAAFQYGARAEERLQRRYDQTFALVHPERRDLHHQHVFVLVHDEAAQEVALGVGHSKGGGVRQKPPADRQRRAETLAEEALAYLHPLGRKQANDDPRFGIVKADSQKALP